MHGVLVYFAPLSVALKEYILTLNVFFCLSLCLLLMCRFLSSSISHFVEPMLIFIIFFNLSIFLRIDEFSTYVVVK